MASLIRRSCLVAVVFLASLVSLRASQALEPPPQTGPTPAGIQEKPAAHHREPWNWTLEERLAVRFDPEDMRRRAEAAGKVDSRGKCIVDGRRNPELLLPSELFANLVRTTFGPLGESQGSAREIILQKGRALGFDESLWDILGSLAKDEIRSATEARERTRRYLEKGEISAPPDLEEKEVACAKRAQSLKAVRAYYGAERFDRFLYEVVASDVVLELPDSPYRRRFLHGDCQ